MSFVVDEIKKELVAAIALSEKYNKIIKSAKTKIKSNTYHKRLEKNNNIIADLLIALNKVEKGNK